ncbi:MAG: hypothetical protein JW730_09605 [Anaerolineales bacterium]|nr:hypothetical protein [Anaerolineales bacterium]
MAYTKLIPQHTPGARVEEISRGDAYRLSIPAGAADKYRLAQVYDYAQTPRSRFPVRAPLRLSLSARTSSDSLPGTWGFGLWNDPFGLSLGFGGNPFRLPALPNAAWFFGASQENYLSFKDPPAERNEVETKRSSQSALRLRATPSAQREVANGFLAQVFRAPRFHPLLILAGVALPFSRRATRRLMGRVISEDGTGLSVDVTQWHRYSLEWRATRVSFKVDNVQVLESPVSPNPPLGLIIWIDNQYAAFTPEGKIGFGVLENPEPAWLEIKDIDVL